MRVYAAGLVLAVCCAAIVPGSAVDAQVVTDPGLRGRTHVGFGYVVNLPRQMMGFSGFVLSPVLRNWGVYVDYKKTTDPRSDDPTFTRLYTAAEAEALGDFRMTAESEWRTFNVAVLRAISPALALYAGGGTSEETAYRRFLDATGERGSSGIYWTEDQRISGRRVNVLGGAIFRALPSFLFQFGVESQPTGATVGASYVLPFGR